MKGSIYVIDMERDFCRFGSLFIKRLFGVLIICSVSFYLTRIALGSLEYTSLNIKAVTTTSQSGILRYRHQLKPRQKPAEPEFIKNVTLNGVTVRYEKCMFIPDPPRGRQWPEEEFRNDPAVTNLANIVSAAKSTVRLTGPKKVRLGDTITLHIELYDGAGNKRTGGDLVHAWMKEETIGAGSVAKVTDNKDGSYIAEFIALWSGTPEIRVAIIAPREVIAIQFKRRYICPPVVTNTGVFQRGGTSMDTPCSYYPQVPGYTKLCNLTEDNYGRPWYCGKPSLRELPCNEWSMASDKRLWDTGYDKQLFTPLETQLLTRNYQAMVIPSNFSLVIQSVDKQVTVGSSKMKCNVPDRRHTWSKSQPVGYLYKKRWHLRTCVGHQRDKYVKECIKNTKILLIGDSTVRQIFASLTDMIPCQWGTEQITPKNKHTTFSCENSSLNYSLEFVVHELPFCTTKLKHHYLKSIKAYLGPYEGTDVMDSKLIVLIHIYTHFLNFHSHVFYESMKRMKTAIIDLLNNNPNAQVIIKGPHSYAFELSVSHNFLQKCQVYMEKYIEYLKQEFKDVQDRVIYLDSADFTIATEQKSLHPEEYIVRETIYKMFDFVCTY